MDIAIISPIAGLDNFSARSNTHLVLAHIRDKEYINFYQEAADQGDFIILDNGAYEGQQPTFDELFTLVEVYNPDVIVLPDFPFQSGEITFNVGLDFLNIALKRGYPCDYMAVPQHIIGEDWSEWWRWTEKFLSVNEIRWIGISKLLRRTFPKSFGSPTLGSSLRASIARKIHSLGDGVSIHALGMLDGDLDDVRALAKTGNINSLDTASPIWRGWNGKDLQTDSWVDIPVDFYAPLPISSTKLKLIDRNLEAVFNASRAR